MNRKEARSILEQMMEGIDPITGEVFPEQHVCNDVTVIRALYKAICALNDDIDQDENAVMRLRANRVNNKKEWTAEEDSYLKNAQKQGATYHEMSRELLRSVYHIKRRMVYLGLATREILGNYHATVAGREHQGLPWYPEEDEKLKAMFRSGNSAREMAVQLKRSVGGITSRLEKTGLIDSK